MDIGQIQAEIKYLPTNEGGRTTPVFSKYRGQFHYEGHDWAAEQIFVDKDICYPGEKVCANLQFASSVFHQGRFHIGKDFQIKEADRTVGIGRIIKIFDPNLEIWYFDEVVDEIKEFSACLSFAETSKFAQTIVNRLRRIKGVTNCTHTQVETNRGNSMIVCTLEFMDEASPLEEIASIWIEGISWKHEKHKIAYEKGHWEFRFITWDNKYVGGKVILRKL